MEFSSEAGKIGNLFIALQVFALWKPQCYLFYLYRTTGVIRKPSLFKNTMIITLLGQNTELFLIRKIKPFFIKYKASGIFYLHEGSFFNFSGINTRLILHINTLTLQEHLWKTLEFGAKVM